MELLLVAQEQISTGEASRALGAFEGLLLGVGPLMAFQMFQSCKRAMAGRADMRARLVSLGWRHDGGGLRCVHGDGRGCRQAVPLVSYGRSGGGSRSWAGRGGLFGWGWAAYPTRRWRECSRQRRKEKRTNWTWRRERRAFFPRHPDKPRGGGYGEGRDRNRGRKKGREREERGAEGGTSERRCEVNQCGRSRHDGASDGGQVGSGWRGWSDGRGSGETESDGEVDCRMLFRQNARALRVRNCVSLVFRGRLSTIGISVRCGGLSVVARRESGLPGVD